MSGIPEKQSQALWGLLPDLGHFYGLLGQSSHYSVHIQKDRGQLHLLVEGLSKNLEASLINYNTVNKKCDENSKKDEFINMRVLVKFSKSVNFSNLKIHFCLSVRNSSE